MTIKVVLADDEAMVRAGLRLLIDGEDDLEVVGEAIDGEDAVRVVGSARPDVVLMDVRMPRMNGLDAAREVLARDEAPRVLVLTTFDEDEVVDEALRRGITGFLLKSSPPQDMVDAIRRAASGQGVIDPSVVPGVISRFGSAPPPVRSHRSSRSSRRARPTFSGWSAGATPTPRSPQSSTSARRR